MPDNSTTRKERNSGMKFDAIKSLLGAEANAAKEVARIKAQRKERIAFWKDVGQVLSIMFGVFSMSMAALWLFFTFFYGAE